MQTLTTLSLEYTQLQVKSLMKTNNCNQMKLIREDLKAKGHAYQRRFLKTRRDRVVLEMCNCNWRKIVSLLCKQLTASTHPLCSVVCVNQMFCTKNSNKHCVCWSTMNNKLLPSPCSVPAYTVTIYWTLLCPGRIGLFKEAFSAEGAKGKETKSLHCTLTCIDAARRSY